ncbi:MAG: chemotaxis protein CheW [Proteobacteria bacterium]|nr:chemotaxis protein CheW [Pseudomonadota bacterium]MBW3618306.1 chemotaxis protein CheW [Pseudomonadota bacterium]
MSAKVVSMGEAVEREFVSMRIADQLFGVEVSEIREVFQLGATSPVPLTRPEITGMLNLRGRIVTTVCARRRLGLPPRPAEAPRPMAVGFDKNGESYGLLVDSVEEVLRLPASAYEAAPVNLDPRWASVSLGVYRLDGRLLVALDVERLLDFGQTAAAA